MIIQQTTEELWDNFKRYNIHTLETLGEELENNAEENFGNVNSCQFSKITDTGSSEPTMSQVELKKK